MTVQIFSDIFILSDLFSDILVLLLIFNLSDILRHPEQKNLGCGNLFDILVRDHLKVPNVTPQPRNSLDQLTTSIGDLNVKLKKKSGPHKIKNDISVLI